MRITQYRRTVLLILLYVTVGVIAGLGAIIFQQLLSLINIYVLQGTVGYADVSIVTGVRRFTLPWAAPEFRQWLLPISAGLGGLITGLIVYRFAPEAAGHGTDEVIHSYHHEHGRIRLRVSMVKLIGSAITIGTGGSGGKEGPIAQIGAGFGSYLCSRIPYYAEYRREVMLAGMAAGIAAIFRAPLAGAIFAAEILHSDMRYNGKVLIPAIIASTISYGVYALYFGFRPVIDVPPFDYTFSLVHFIPFTMLALLASFGAFLFVKIFYGIRDVFSQLSLKPYLKPMIGGVLTGITALWFAPAFGEGSFHMQQMVQGNVPLLGMFLLFILKMLTTSFSIGSGGSGGIFGPSLMIGAALGGTVGSVYLELVPESTIPLVAFVLLGMVGFFSGAANAPISTVIIITEMTYVFNLTVPFLWVAMFGYIFSQRWNIYENQVSIQRQILDTLDPIESQQELESLTVGELMLTDFPTVEPKTPLSEVIPRLNGTQWEALPIVDPLTRHVIGLINKKSVHAVIDADRVIPNPVARDAAIPIAEYVREDDNMLDALRRIEKSTWPFVVVYRRDDDRRITGVLQHSLLFSPPPRTWIDYLSLRRVLIDISAANREEAITKVVEIAHYDIPHFSSDQVEAAVRKREEQISTAMNSGVAFPHAKLPGLHQPIMVLARLKRGVDWGSRDGKRVRLVFLTITPEETPEIQLNIARGIARLVREEITRAGMLRAPTPAIMLDIIRDATSQSDNP